jgi:hypothetical protein
MNSMQNGIPLGSVKENTFQSLSSLQKYGLETKVPMSNINKESRKILELRLNKPPKCLALENGNMKEAMRITSSLLKLWTVKVTSVTVCSCLTSNFCNGIVRQFDPE